MARKTRDGFSRGWVLASIAAFTVVEIVIGGYIAPVLAGRFISSIAELKLEVLLVLGSYLVGGFLIGLFSPTVRVAEASVGAFVAALLPFMMGVLSPVRFYVTSTGRMVAAGLISAFLAYTGADAGERVEARLGNRDSQDYAKDNPD